MIRTQKGASTLQTCLVIGGVVLAVGALGPRFAAEVGAASGQATTGAAKAAVAATAAGAATVCAPGGLDHLCAAVPASKKTLDEQARQRQQATSATTIPVPQPYGPANGPIRPLPSVRPVAPAEPTAGRPQLGDAPEGGLIGDIPVLGPVIEGGLKELAPVVKAP